MTKISSTLRTLTLSPLGRATPTARTPSSARASGPSAVTRPAPGLAGPARSIFPTHGGARLPQLRTLAAKNVFDLVPENAGDAVPFPELVTRMVRSRPSAEKLRVLLEQALAGTDIEVPAVVTLMRDPSAVLELTVMRLAKLKRLAVTVSAVAPERNTREELRLASGTHIDAPFEVELPSRELKPLAQGVLRGWPASTLDPNEARHRIRMAQVFEALTENAMLPKSEQVSLRYDRRAFTDLETFLDHLRDEGHEARIVFEQRLADFLGLYVAEKEGVRPVAATLMLDTGLVDRRGERIVVPTTHGEMQISILPPEGKSGISAELCFFQGTNGTAFIPKGLNAPPAWVGKKLSGAETGDAAWEAIKLAGQLRNVIQAISNRDHMRLRGYGVTGVCNDTASFLARENTMYPLAHEDELLLRQIETWLSTGQQDRVRLERLKEKIAATPSDMEVRPHQAGRILASLPWEAGREPFVAAQHARRALTEMVAGLEASGRAD